DEAHRQAGRATAPVPDPIAHHPLGLGGETVKGRLRLRPTFALDSQWQNVVPENGVFRIRLRLCRIGNLSRISREGSREKDEESNDEQVTHDALSQPVGCPTSRSRSKCLTPFGDSRQS